MGNPWAYDFSAVGARTAPLLVIVGGDGEAQRNARGGFSFGGNSDVYQLIPEDLRFDQLNLGRQFLKAAGRPDPARYDCVLNLVTDADLHPKTLESLRKLLRNYRGRVINRPETVLRSTRDQVARRLAGTDGLRVPKVVRLRNPKPGAASKAAERAGLCYPVIVRHAGTHTGRIVGLAEGSQALDAAASGAGEFIVIEFVDFRSPDGLYRKYRLWSFGGRTIFRHMVTTDNWNVHVSERVRFMLDRDELVEEEMRLLSKPEGAFPGPVHAAFNEARKRLGLDFFGMDFALDGTGGMVLFEANATMSFFPLEPHPRFAYLNCISEPARAAFREMLLAAR
jgi:hypothetical protein